MTLFVLDSYTISRKMLLVMPNSGYTSLIDYMERTGTTGDRLLELVNDKLRGSKRMSRMHLSYLLRGSRRMSGEHAWAFCQVTGVPMEELTRWPRDAKSTDSPNVRSVAGDSHA